MYAPAIANDPECECDALNDGTPAGEAAYLLCQDEGCTGTAIAPVTNNLWILVSAGIGLGFYCFIKKKNMYKKEVGLEYQL